MTNATVELLAKDLNHQGGVYCPSPLAHMSIWNSHPKVYLDVARTGQAKCPTAARSTSSRKASTSTAINWGQIPINFSLQLT